MSLNQEIIKIKSTALENNYLNDPVEREILVFHPDKIVDNSIMFNFKRKNNPVENIKKRLNKHKIENIPKYVRYENSIILKTDLENRYVAKVFAEELKIKNVYIESGRIRGDMRIPSLKLLYGNGGDDIVLEDDIKYMLDPERIMFSPGNINVRSNMKKRKSK